MRVWETPEIATSKFWSLSQGTKAHEAQRTWTVVDTCSVLQIWEPIWGEKPKVQKRWVDQVKSFESVGFVPLAGCAKFSKRIARGSATGSCLVWGDLGGYTLKQLPQPPQTSAVPNCLSWKACCTFGSFRPTWYYMIWMLNICFAWQPSPNAAETSWSKSAPV